MSDPAEDLLESIRALLRVFTVDETRFPPAEGRVKYNAHDFQALHFIATNEGCSGADLAAYLGVAATTAQSVIERLIDRGFVERRENPDNRRAIALILSAEGVALTAAIRRQDLRNCRTMLGVLPSADRKRFAAQLRAIANAFTDEGET